jgi:hypothetical protein
MLVSYCKYVFNPKNIIVCAPNSTEITTLTTSQTDDPKHVEGPNKNTANWSTCWTGPGKNTSSTILLRLGNRKMTDNQGFVSILRRYLTMI